MNNGVSVHMHEYSIAVCSEKVLIGFAIAIILYSTLLVLLLEKHIQSLDCELLDIHIV